MKKNNRLLSVSLLVISLITLVSVAILIQKRNFNDQSRASDGTIMVGQLIRSSSSMLCTKCVQQCPGADNVLRDCNPMASYGISIDSMCNSAGRVEMCGGKSFCCPKPNSKWTTDLSKCPGVTPPVRTPSEYRLLKSGGVCTAVVISKNLGEPLVNQQVVLTGSIKEPYFYANQISKYKCVQQCPSIDNVLRDCTPPESDGTSRDSLCNTKGKIETCGGIKYCCPAPGTKWTKDLSRCPATTPTPTSVTNKPPYFTTAKIPDGVAGSSYYTTIQAKDPDSGDTLSLTISNLPSGFSQGPCAVPVGGGEISCNIQGTPSTAGYYTINAKVSDNHRGSASRSYSFSVLPSVTPTPSSNTPPKITTTSLPSGSTSSQYAADITATDPDPNDEPRLTISNLPSGIAVGPCSSPVGGGQVTCYLSGTPSSAGYYTINVKASDSHGASTSSSLGLSITE